METHNQIKVWHTKFNRISKILSVLVWIVFIFMLLGIIPDINTQIRVTRAALQENHYTLFEQFQLYFRSVFSVLIFVIERLFLWTILQSISLGLKTLVETDQSYRIQQEEKQTITEPHQAVFYDPNHGYKFLSKIKKYKWPFLFISAISLIGMLSLLSRAVFLPTIGVNNQNIFYLFMIGILGILSLIFLVPILLISFKWIENLLHGLIDIEGNSRNTDQ